MKLSIGMIVKNEEKYLGKCLTALQPILEQVDSELIVVDTGSTDKTVEIAKKHTDNVYFFEWIGDFAAARNESLKYAKGEWFLFIDADEILQNTKELIKFFNSNEYLEYNSAMIIINNISSKNEDCNSKIFLNRLNKIYPNTKFTGIVHEGIPYLSPNKLLRNTMFNHYGYGYESNEKKKQKGRRNTELLLKKVEEYPDNLLLRTQLTDSYLMLDEFENALIHAKKAIDLCGQDKSKFYFTAQLNLIRVYYSSNDILHTVETCENYLSNNTKIYLTHIDVLFMLTQAYINLKKIDNAISNYEKYATLYEQYNKNQLTAEDEISVCLYYASVHAFIPMTLQIIEAYINNNNLTRAKKLLTSKELQNYDNKINIKGRFYLEFKIMKINNNYDAIKRIYTNIYSCENSNEILNEFEECIEAFIIDNNKEICMDILNILSSLSYERDYIKYSKLRLKIINNDKINTEDLYMFIESSNKLDIKYSDILYYIFKSNASLSYNMSKLPIELILNCTNYQLGTKKDLLSLILDYKISTSNDTIIFAKILDILMQRINEDNKTNYKETIIAYYNSTSYLLKTLYPNLKGNTELLKFYPSDIRFMYYFNLAYENKDTDKKVYIQNLRQALVENEIMKGVVELLLKEITEEEKEYNDNKNEFEELATAVKKQIKMFIKSNDILTARTLLEQYKQINPNDEDILNLEEKIKL